MEQIAKLVDYALKAEKLNMREEALDAFLALKEIFPTCPLVRIKLAIAYLYTKQFKEGLKELEHRFDPPIENEITKMQSWPAFMGSSATFKNFYQKPLWDGKEDIKDKTILVFDEAGFGDYIQYIRYLPKLKEKGCKIILEVKPELYELFQNLGVETTLWNKEEKMKAFFFAMTKIKGYKPPLPPHDYVASVFSFPYYFDPDLSKIPLEQYLFPKQKTNLIEKSNKFKIGLVWAGNRQDSCDQNRSCYLKKLAILAEIPNVQLFSLQKGDTKLQLDVKNNMIRNWEINGEFESVNLLEGTENLNLIDLDAKINDFTDTAQAIQELDLIISIDSAVIHLTGALNKSGFLMLPFTQPDWRWQLNWYPSVKIFRQKSHNDWEGLIQEVKKEVESEINFKKFKNSP